MRARLGNDAYAARCLPLRPGRPDHDEYRPARMKVRVPYDFYMVTDHSVTCWGGPSSTSSEARQIIMEDPAGRQYYEDSQRGRRHPPPQAMFPGSIAQFAQGQMPDALNYQPGNPAYKRVWDETVAAAEEFNDPGHFTTFIAFEWTSLVGRQQSAPQRDLPRRCRARAGQVEPFTTTPPIGSPNPARSCGSGCGTTKKGPEAMCWRSRTTAIYPTA